MKEALHEFKEHLTITQESIKAAKKRRQGQRLYHTQYFNSRKVKQNEKHHSQNRFTTQARHEKKKNNNVNNNNRVIKEVALGKTSKLSTQHTNYISGKANDGNLNTISATVDEPLPFWEVDLGHESKIIQIEIFVRKDCCGNLVRQLDILVGPSHNKLEKCAQYEGPAQTGFHLVFECPHIIMAAMSGYRKNIFQFCHWQK
ncbi:unnamed protein product [Mytilus coruscus]|uniref:Fucolectin tachylectin-4 pentraxin-1 domain-containing protein n=1 Tax=Mytilus coruscus TaxID=42192 RepID=A0A6J8DVJ3_MYTCO|nr:unnamed protein product [Mytilus coruscus]